MNNLAVLLHQTGDPEAARRLLRQCLSGRRKVLGEHHPATLATSESLRRLEEGAGRPGPAPPPTGPQGPAPCGAGSRGRARRARPAARIEPRLLNGPQKLKIFLPRVFNN